MYDMASKNISKRSLVETYHYQVLTTITLQPMSLPIVCIHNQRFVLQNKSRILHFLQPHTSINFQFQFHKKTTKAKIGFSPDKTKNMAGLFMTTQAVTIS